MFTEPFDASVEQFVDPSVQMPWLHFVASIGTIEWIDFMLARSKEKDRVYKSRLQGNNFVESTPLLSAMISKRDPTIIMRLLREDIDVNKGDSTLLPVHLILKYKNPDLLRAFLKKKPKLDAPNINKRTFFHLYFEENTHGSEAPLSPDEFSAIVLEAPRDSLTMKDFEGNTPVHLALKARRMEEAYVMLSKDSSLLWALNNAKKAPLNMLEGERCRENLDELIDKTIALKQTSLMNSLLLWCAQNYYHVQCNKLIKAGASTNVRQAAGQNLLHLACLAGAHRAVAELLKHKLPVDEKDSKGIAPLHIAAEREDLPLMRLLLSHQAQPDIADQTGRTPLHIAVEKENPELVSLLLENKATSNKMNHALETPLSKALNKLTKSRSDKMQKIVNLLETSSCGIQ